MGKHINNTTGDTVLECEWGGGCSNRIEFHHDAPYPEGWFHEGYRVLCPEHNENYTKHIFDDGVLRFGTTPRPKDMYNSEEVARVMQVKGPAQSMNTSVPTNPKNYESLGPEAPTVVNAQGGKQSKVAYRMDLLDPYAMFELGFILEQGAKKYGDNNWHKISRREHLNHALVHIFAELMSNEDDDHIGHALCRLMFAVATRNEARDDGSFHVLPDE